MIALWLARAAVATEPLADAPVLDEVAESPVDAGAGDAVSEETTTKASTKSDLLSDEDDEEQKDETGKNAVEALPAGPDLAGLWPFGLAAVGAGALLFARRSRGVRAAELTVVSRTAVSGQSALLLVDVRDPLGREHRLLVGVGGGPPALVADLGMADDAESEVEVEVEEAPSVYTGRRAAASVHLNRELLESPTLPNLRGAQRAGRKADAQALISEIVEERRTAMVRS